MTPQTEMVPPCGVDDFLEQNGWGGALVSPLAGDASFRRYFRVRSDGGAGAVLMDAPPPHEDPRPFIEVAQYLTQAGFRAPAIFAQDLARGLVLLEDFGDEQMREHLDHFPDHEAAVYRQAIDTIIALSRVECAKLPPYDAAAYLREVRLLIEWYMPAMHLQVDEHAFNAVWAKALEPVCEYHKVTVLRDYHAENIMLLDDGGQGLIDFQDALIGHPAYDLVSLLQDARRQVLPEFEAEMLEYYQKSAKPDGDFDVHYALLGAQRNTKIIGIFTRLWKRDGKERYLSFLPRMWGLLERDLGHPGLAPLKAWFDENIPPETRKVSPERVAVP